VSRRTSSKAARHAASPTSRHAATAGPMPQPSRTLTIVAQDPTLVVDGRILTATVTVPNEQLSAGPRGYRVQVVDYDASSNQWFVPLEASQFGSILEPRDPYAKGRRSPAAFNARLLDDPRFHAQNVYAIAMRTLAHFERALGRRVSWSFGGHQIKAAPHAFAEANAFYSPDDEALLFGYFDDGKGRRIFNCLSHDIVAHEATHALVDGLRPRYMEPSSPDQGAFHEGFADVVALLSVFSVREVVEYAVASAVVQPGKQMVPIARLTIDALQKGVLLGLGEQFGEALSGVHGSALRRSVTLKPSKTLKNTEEYREEHTRGELLVASVLRAFLSAYEDRLTTLGLDSEGRLPAGRVAEEGADIAERLQTMSIRALDYMPPTDVSFGDYISALITSDLEMRPDDSRYHLREHLLKGFAAFGFSPSSSYGGEDGRWEPPLEPLTYEFVHREALQRDRDEVFRFLWDNRKALGLCDEAYTEVGGVRPCLRTDVDGFTLRETVADYVQILTVRADEIEAIAIPGSRKRIRRPPGLDNWQTVRILGGGALIFDEFGRLKYHVRNAVLNPDRQSERLAYLAESGSFDRDPRRARGFAALHMKGMRPSLPSVTKEERPWR
jgi:hypothetical protein